MDNNILIKNVYYMLSYAFKELKQNNYETLSGESFEDVEDLFAEILIIGISKQLKNGLYKTYVKKEESISQVRGKIDIDKTIENKIKRKNKIFCLHEEYSEDNIYNQILKTTSYYLIKFKNTKKERKNRLKRLLPFFDNVSFANLSNLQWNKLVFYRQNRGYALLINICFYLYRSMLLTTEKGPYKMAHFLDQNLAGLYEKFVFQYYKRHFPDIKVSAKKIKWDLDIADESAQILLPDMKTDICLEYGNKTLIIDTKYYSKTMVASHYGDKEKLRSGHLYQILSYVKNKDTNGEGNVAGLLLYAKTNEEICPDFSYMIGGNRIEAKTLDLNCEFKRIGDQLNKIALEYFGITN